jgi:hypothetical protein
MNDTKFCKASKQNLLSEDFFSLNLVRFILQSKQNFQFAEEGTSAISSILFFIHLIINCIIRRRGGRLASADLLPHGDICREI